MRYYSSLKATTARLLSRHFCLQPFFAKGLVSLLLVQLTISIRCSMVSTKGKSFDVQVSRLLDNSFPTLSLTSEAQLEYRLSATAAIFLGTLEFLGVLMRLTFLTQFKIDFLLPFTGCRNILGKISVQCQAITVLGIPGISTF